MRESGDHWRLAAPASPMNCRAGDDASDGASHQVVFVESVLKYPAHRSRHQAKLFTPRHPSRPSYRKCGRRRSVAGCVAPQTAPHAAHNSGESVEPQVKVEVMTGSHDAQRLT